MTEDLLRLGKSFIPLETDRFIPFNHAADAFLVELTEMPGTIPSKTLRHLAPILRSECKRMFGGDVFSVEVTNFNLHTGSARIRGLYPLVRRVDDIGGIAVRLTVSFDGQVFRHRYDLTPRMIHTLVRVLGLEGTPR